MLKRLLGVLQNTQDCFWSVVPDLPKILLDLVSQRHLQVGPSVEEPTRASFRERPGVTPGSPVLGSVRRKYQRRQRTGAGEVDGAGRAREV